MPRLVELVGHPDKATRDAFDGVLYRAAIAERLTVDHVNELAAIVNAAQTFEEAEAAFWPLELVNIRCDALLPALVRWMPSDRARIYATAWSGIPRRHRCATIARACVSRTRRRTCF